MGVTTWVDASGRVRARRVSAGPDYLVVTPALRDGARTFYAWAGDTPLALLLGIASLAYAAREWRSRRSRGRGATSGNGDGDTATGV